MDNIVEAKKPNDETKDGTKMQRYDEIEKEVKIAVGQGETERVLLLNELTLARNIHQKAVSKKDFAVCYAAFVNNGKVIKRAGIYATDGKDAISQEEAEDILLAQDFANMKVLAIPRNSMYTSLF